jgi:hypothetical protein
VHTVSELLFERYLTERELSFDYEPHMGRTRPDYSINHAGQAVILEVKEFDDPNPRPRGGFTVCPAIRNKIREARRQFAECRDRPCGIVLNNPASIFRLLDVMSVASACFGKYIQQEPAFDGRLHIDAPSYTFSGGKAALTRAHSTTLSAAIILAHYHIDELWFATWRQLWKKQASGLPIQPNDQLDIINQLAPTVHPRYRFEGTIRLIILHNPHARIPFPSDVFDGPFDQHWGTKNGRYELLRVGDKLRELSEEGVPYIYL